jgi:hypothetical protein
MLRAPQLDDDRATDGVLVTPAIASARAASRRRRAARAGSARQRRAACSRNLASGLSASGAVHVSSIDATQAPTTSRENLATVGDARRRAAYLQVDPFVGSEWNAYGYASSNPVLRTDRTGLCEFGDCDDGIGVTGIETTDIGNMIPVPGGGGPDPCPRGYSRDPVFGCVVNDKSIVTGLSVWDGTLYGEQCKEEGTCWGDYGDDTGDDPYHDRIWWSGSKGETTHHVDVSSLCENYRNILMSLCGSSFKTHRDQERFNNCTADALKKYGECVRGEGPFKGN